MKANSYIGFIFISMLFYACQKQPECSSFETKRMVLELARNLMVEEIAFLNYAESKYDLDIQQNPEEIFILILTAEDVKKEIADEVKYGSEIESEYTEIISAADSIYRNLSPDLTNIRTSSIQTDIKKCSCEASLILSNKENVELNYIVQINDKKELFVDVNVKKQD